MRTHHFLLALALLFITCSVSAQHEQTVLGGRSFRFSGIWGGSQHQLTQFGNSNSYVNGWHFGLEFGKSILIGLGGYGVEDDVKWDQIQNQDFEMRWRTLMLGYGFRGYKAVHPLITVDAGPGKVGFAHEAKDNIFVVQPAAGVEINVFRWFHLGLQGGYRFVTDSSIAGLDDESLSGPFGQAILKFGFSWGRYHKRAADRYEDND